MLSLPPSVRVFVAVEPVDMRGSFDALAGAVRRLGLVPVNGHLYLFLNKRRRLAKALWFDGSGWWWRGCCEASSQTMATSSPAKSGRRPGVRNSIGDCARSRKEGAS